MKRLKEEMSLNLVNLNKSIDIAIFNLRRVGAYHETEPVLHAYNLGFKRMAYYLDTLLTIKLNLLKDMRESGV